MHPMRAKVAMHGWQPGITALAMTCVSCTIETPSLKFRSDATAADPVGDSHGVPADTVPGDASPRVLGAGDTFRATDAGEEAATAPDDANDAAQPSDFAATVDVDAIPPPCPAFCDDGNACTTDTCDGAKGCVHAQSTTSCRDGDACTEGDTCAGGKCVAGPGKNCDDGNPCT